MGRDGRWLGDAGRCSWATGVHSGAGGRRLSGPVFLCGASRGKAERQKGRKAERQKHVVRGTQCGAREAGPHAQQLHDPRTGNAVHAPQANNSMIRAASTAEFMKSEF